MEGGGKSCFTPTKSGRGTFSHADEKGEAETLY